MARLLGNANLDKIYTSQNEFKPGDIVEDGNGSLYRFIKYNAGDGPVTAVAGYLIIGLDSAYNAYEGTCDYSSATIKALLQRPLGFGQAAFTDGTYGWAQISGPNRNVITTGGGIDAQGELLMAHATTDGAVDTHDAGAKSIVGISREIDDTGTATQLAAGEAIITIPV